MTRKKKILPDGTLVSKRAFWKWAKTGDPARYKKHQRWQWFRRILFVILVAVLGIAGYVGTKAYLASAKVLNGGSLISLLEPGTPLQTDSSGRVNILVFGTSQDDAAHMDADGGGGLWLTDSIQLVSIDTTDNTVKMVAIPRDLYVSIDSDCSVGSYSKINAVYECAAGLSSSDSASASDYKTKDATGAEALEAKVAEVTGITPHYYVHADYSVLKQAVDAVGGVDVDIVGDGSDGIYDTNFDWDCSGGAYTCKNVYYPTNGTYHLDGTAALYLARARADSGLYSYKDFGLAQGDFDRQANQQKILTALQAKVTSASVFANPVALSGLIDAFGSNLTTSLTGGELKTLLTDVKKVPNTSITSVSLVTKGSAVVTTGTVGGASVVEATSGLYDYSSITSYLGTQLAVPVATTSN